MSGLTLNDLTADQLRELRELAAASRGRAASRLERLVPDVPLGTIADFMDQVVLGGADAASWGRGDRLCVPALPPRLLLAQPVEATLAPLGAVEGRRWLRMPPRASEWDWSPFCGGPGVLVADAPYWFAGPAGADWTAVDPAALEPVGDLEVAARRWIASRAAFDLRAGPLPDTPAGIATAIGITELAPDGEIALAGLLRERSLADDGRLAPGFRGPDEWYRR